MKHSKFRKLSWAEVKNREMPLHFTLLCYFLLFGLLILVVLWIFQSFFLESFYTSTKKNAAEKSAKIIAESLENNQNPLATIENVASYNSLCVQVYDTSTAFFQKRYECNYASPSVSLNIEAHKVYSYYSCASDNNGSCLEIIGENERQDGLFEDYEKNTATNDTASKFNWKRKSSGTAKIMTYGKILSLEDGTECFVIVSSVITPINNTIEIIKDQIFVISIVFFVLAVAISLYASQRIAKPISLTTKAAKELAKKNYDVEFDSKGYLEVQELNDTLNFAKKELAANERLQRELIANISHDLRTPPIELPDVEKLYNITVDGKGDIYQNARINARMCYLLSYYIQYFPAVNEEFNHYVLSAAKYIELNYRNSSFTATDVSNYLKLDRSYLYKLFKSEMGMSVHDYINKLRISRASSLLATSNLTIKDVASESGFADQMYFSRLFKKKKNLTPSQYRSYFKDSQQDDI